jgi:hypothetical protein
MKYLGEAPVRHDYKHPQIPVPDGTPVYWNKIKEYYYCVLHGNPIYFPKRFIKHIDAKVYKVKLLPTKLFRRK